MNRSRILMGLAVVSACLAAGSARLVFAQQNDPQHVKVPGAPTPVGMPVVVPQSPNQGVPLPSPGDVLRTQQQFSGGVQPVAQPGNSQNPQPPVAPLPAPPSLPFPT